jgi:nucleotide-binding universal stress UspA family protein
MITVKDLLRKKGAQVYSISQAAKNIRACRFISNEVIVEAGNASERILHHVATIAYDILVMVSRGLGLVQGAFFVSTSLSETISYTDPTVIGGGKQPIKEPEYA